MASEDWISRRDVVFGLAVNVITIPSFIDVTAPSSVSAMCGSYLHWRDGSFHL